MRIGIVSFINAWPLTYYLKDFFPDAQIYAQVPSLLAQNLLQGQLDVALLSTIVHADLYPQTRIMPYLGVASDGPVLSVNLFLQKDQKEWNTKKNFCTVALDPASRSSNAMLKILFAHCYPNTKIQWTLPEMHTSLETRLQNADAVLAIGDTALQHIYTHQYWDLGQWWQQVFAKPFVYAAWIIRKQSADQKIFAGLQQSLDRGLANLPTIIHAARKQNPHLTMDLLERYFTRHIQYRHDSNHIQGLQMYFQQLKKLNLIGNVPEI